MVNVFSTPILLNVFNRPEETRMVLSVIREVQPRVLYVHCDGPRPNNEKDANNVAMVRSVVDEMVDWPCDLHKLYEDENLGCGMGPATSISWFFSNVEEGIILEDDCKPNHDFFVYCQLLLERYRDVENVGIISGTHFSSYKDVFSYRFTAYAGIWGWATWRRVWNLFDYNFDKTDSDFYSQVCPFLKSKNATRYWLNILRKLREDREKDVNVSYWDYQLHLCLMYANKIHIAPNYNLISNIGFNDNATHTFDESSRYANRGTESILPLVHPVEIFVNHRIDNLSYSQTLKKRIKRFAKILVKYVRK